MTVSLEGEVGDSPDEQKQQFYQKHLKKLNRNQLNRLMNKIFQITKDLVKDSEEHKQFAQIQKLVEDTVDPLIASSMEHTIVFAFG